jgi:hypothetical protein
MFLFIYFNISYLLEHYKIYHPLSLVKLDFIPYFQQMTFRFKISKIIHTPL